MRREDRLIKEPPMRTNLVDRVYHNCGLDEIGRVEEES